MYDSSQKISLYRYFLCSLEDKKPFESDVRQNLWIFDQHPAFLTEFVRFCQHKPSQKLRLPPTRAIYTINTPNNYEGRSFKVFFRLNSDEIQLISIFQSKISFKTNLCNQIQGKSLINIFYWHPKVPIYSQVNKTRTNYPVYSRSLLHTIQSNHWKSHFRKCCYFRPTSILENNKIKMCLFVGSIKSCEK